jgi:hypothetical protein
MTGSNKMITERNRLAALLSRAGDLNSGSLVVFFNDVVFLQHLRFGRHWRFGCCEISFEFLGAAV